MRAWRVETRSWCFHIPETSPAVRGESGKYERVVKNKGPGTCGKRRLNYDFIMELRWCVTLALSWPIASYSPSVSSFLYKLDTGIGFVFLRSNKYITVFRLGQIGPIANRNLYLGLFAYGAYCEIDAGSNSDSSDISGSDPMMISLYPLGVESNNKEDGVWRVARGRGRQGSIRDVQFWFIGPLFN